MQDIKHKIGYVVVDEYKKDIKKVYYFEIPVNGFFSKKNKTFWYDEDGKVYKSGIFSSKIHDTKDAAIKYCDDEIVKREIQRAKEYFEAKELVRKYENVDNE